MYVIAHDCTYLDVTNSSNNYILLHFFSCIYRLSNNFISITYMPSPQVALQQLGFHFSQFGSNQLKATRTNDTLIVWSPVDELKHYNFILHYGVTIIDLIHKFSRTNRPLLNGPINLVAVPKTLDGYEISSWNLLTNR